MMESSTPESRRAIAMDFPANDPAVNTPPLPSSRPRTIPKRLRKRLLVEPKTPSTAQDIEAKLRLAHLRRQQFYDNLSSKARPKPRSPSLSASPGEDLGQRLEAKLQAAKQKRLSILEKARKRLAKLDELRQAAKTGVELRFQKERERLGIKVKLRIQQAEANRMVILKARRQRRAILRERTSQSLLRRIIRDNKYKELVRAAINQKRAAAEKKRISLLEAEKKRVRARVLQVQRIANSISQQREVERRRMRDQLEYRLQRAKRQRAEYLRRRGRQHSSAIVIWNRNYKQADVLSRKLARCWRQFHQLKRTTLELATDFDALKINESSVKSMPFEQLARLIESLPTLQTVKALLHRIESRLMVSCAVAADSHSSSMENIDHLLKRVATPRKKMTPRTPMRNRVVKKAGGAREVSKSPAKLSRYPVRVFLCGYMILGNPDAVFSGQGERENALAKSAEEFIQQFELILKIILEGPMQSSDEESDSLSLKRCTFRSQLTAFDKAWCSYLNCFVTWKIKDAEYLEDDLVRAACQLELSMIQKCKLTPSGESDEQLSHDMKAIQKQVLEDQKLLREKLQHLSGDAGIERMEWALSEMRSKYFQAKEDGSPVFSPVANITSPSVLSSAVGPSFSSPSDRINVTEGVERPSHVVRSLFNETKNLSRGPTSSSSTMGGQSCSSIQNLVAENEFIVNEFLHERCSSFAEQFNEISEDGNNIRQKVKKTVEQAFWDGIMEALKQEEPNYDRVVQLVMEIRDEIIDMAPKSWRQEILDSIDLDIISQVLRSGNLDIHFLGKMLQFAVGTLQKLASPIQEDEMKIMHQKVLEDLAETCQTHDESKNSNAVAMVKGLRFVLEQIQALKQEISKARIRIMEPLLRGQAGLDYLRKAFADRHGSHLDAHTSLPFTVQWLSSVGICKDQEWEEHTQLLSIARDQESSSVVLVPPTTLRSGGRLQSGTGQNGPLVSDTRQPEPECSGERIDLLVRLGLSKLVSGVSGLTQEDLPETFMLNLSRLRAVQSEIQKIIVASVSILICRQTLLMERAVSSSADMESIISKCTKQLLNVLDTVDNVGVEEIVIIISEFSQDGNKVESGEVVQSRKLVMGRMLAKSLQAGDPVFEKVSRAIYLATRGVVLGGSGLIGRRLAEVALSHVGATLLTDRVVEAAEVLVVAATVSESIHGPWYVSIVGNM